MASPISWRAPVALAVLFVPAIWITLRQVRNKAAQDTARGVSFAGWIGTSRRSGGTLGSRQQFDEDLSTALSSGSRERIATVLATRYPLFTTAEIGTLGASARLAEDYDTVDSRHQDKKFVTPASELPASKTEIEAALVELIGREADPARLVRLRGLYVDLARYGPDSEVRVLDDYFRRRQHGPRLTKAEWDRAKLTMKRSTEATRRASTRLLELCPVPVVAAAHRGRLASIDELNEALGPYLLLVAMLYAVYAGYALIIANLAVRSLSAFSKIEPVVFAGAVLSAPMVGFAGGLALLEATVRLRRRDPPDRLALLAGLVVPILWILLLFGLAAQV